MGKIIVIIGVVMVTACPVQAIDIFLDADTADTGSLLDTQPLVTLFGVITFDGEILDYARDPDFIAVGALGNVFDINNDPISSAQLFFDFEIASLTFIYGGQGGGILVEARDAQGTVLDSFFQANTDDGQPAGPVSLSGSGIRSLYWEDPGNSFAALDNIGIVVPEPATLLLFALGGLLLIKRS